jgi:hypothetical protein
MEMVIYFKWKGDRKANGDNDDGVGDGDGEW